MGIKIGRAEFSRHEFVLLILCLGFFSLIFFGSFKFGLMGKVFPLLIGGPGLLMVALYLISGFLSPKLHDAMKKDTDFRLFGMIPEKYEIKSDQSEREISDQQESRFNIQLSYIVLALFAGYVLLSYLFGFYFSTFVFTSAYLFLFTRGDTQKSPSILAKLILLCVLMGAVFLFDYSFGHDFMEGAVFKLFG